MLQKLGKVPKEEAVESLLKSIYDTDVVSEQLCNRSVAEHVEEATPRDKVLWGLPNTTLFALLFFHSE